MEDALYKDVDRIVVVGDGRIVADMTPDQLLSCDILMKEGIREPLYVTALKHAGCTISEKIVRHMWRPWIFLPTKDRYRNGLPVPRHRQREK